MKNKLFPSILILVMLSSLLGFPGALSAISSNDLIGDRINIAVLSGEQEKRPAVAFCMNHWLVVYERAGGIFGQRLNPDGTLVGDAFLIFSGDQDSYHPDVACLYDSAAVYNYFIVTWTFNYNGDDEDIRARAVRDLPSGSDNFFGGWIPVSQATDLDEARSAIACNHEDETCLVVFEYYDGAPRVLGQRIILGVSGISTDGSLIDMNTVLNDAEIEPSVVWARDQNAFMVAWSNWWDDSSPTNNDHYHLMKITVHDTKQSGGASQLMISGPRWMVNPDDTANNLREPSVAYNDHTGRFLLSYRQDSTPPTSSYMIFDIDQTYQLPTYITNYVVGATAAAYSRGTVGNPWSFTPDEFMIAYNFDGKDIDGQIVQDLMPKGPLIIVEMADSLSYYLDNPDVSGNQTNGTYLVVWDEWNGSSFNVYGQLVDHGTYYNTYLPLVTQPD